MKNKTIALIMSMGLCSSVFAQQKVYICDGYGYDAYDVNAATDIRLSADRKSITICEDTYLLTDFDSITFSEPQFDKVVIKYNGTSASVSIPASYAGVTCTSGTSSHVVIKSATTDKEYLYSLEGTSSDGSFTLNGNYKLSVELAGIDLTSKKGAAVDIECGKRIDILVKDGTVNSFADYANGDQKAAFYSKGHMEFKGAGTLSVTGNAKHALGAKEYIEFKGSLGTVNILGAESDGIHCGKGEKGDGENNYFQMNGGNVTISKCGSDCIDSDDYGCVRIKGGRLNITVSQADGCGIKCDSLFTMTGGNIDIDITGASSEGIRSNYRGTFSGGTITENVSGKGTRGIRGKACTKVTDKVKGGGYIDFSGTNVVMTVSGVNDSENDQKCFGIKADKELTQTAGDLTINVTSTDKTTKGINADADNWTGGTRNGKNK